MGGEMINERGRGQLWAVGIIILLAFTLSSSFALAQTKKPAARMVRGGWVLNCATPQKKLRCKVSQSVVLGKTGQLLISVTVRKPEKSKPPAMMIHLPHGLYLPAGVSVAFDKGKTEKIPVQTSDAKGAYAGLPLTGNHLKALQTGKTLTITFQNLKKKNIVVPLPLNGFSESFKKLS